MAKVIVVRSTHRKVLSDPNSKVVYGLKQKSGDSKTYDIKCIAEEVEELGAMSAEDVEHVISAVVRNMKRKLTDGNRVKLDGFGTFYITLGCRTTENEEECTVKNIEKVRIRFKADNTLRLVNESLATTKGGANNICFELDSKTSSSGSGNGDNGSTGGGNGDDGGNGNPLE